MKVMSIINLAEIKQFIQNIPQKGDCSERYLYLNFTHEEKNNQITLRMFRDNYHSHCCRIIGDEIDENIKLFQYIRGIKNIDDVLYILARFKLFTSLEYHTASITHIDILEYLKDIGKIEYYDGYIKYDGCFDLEDPRTVFRSHKINTSPSYEIMCKYFEREKINKAKQKEVYAKYQAITMEELEQRMKEVHQISIVYSDIEWSGADNLPSYVPPPSIHPLHEIIRLRALEKYKLQY